MTDHCRTIREAAAYLGIGYHQLSYAIRNKKGPRRSKNEGRLDYRFAELDRWKQAREPVVGLTPLEASARLGLSLKYLNKLRTETRGPKFRHYGRFVRYDLADLDRWNALRLRAADQRVARLQERAAALIAEANSLKSLTVRASATAEAFE